MFCSPRLEKTYIHIDTKENDGDPTEGYYLCSNFILPLLGLTVHKGVLYIN